MMSVGDVSSRTTNPSFMFLSLEWGEACHGARWNASSFHFLLLCAVPTSYGGHRAHQHLNHILISSRCDKLGFRPPKTIEKM